MEFKILLNNIEQLELALEHIQKGDPNNARFALMLADNAIELTLHHAAKDKETEVKWKKQAGQDYKHEAALNDAVGRNFDKKVSFAQILEILNAQEAGTIIACHQFRNEVYHVGLQHEPILLELSRFYLHLISGILGKYYPRSLSYKDLKGQPPEKVQKYFPVRDFGFYPALSEYQKACLEINKACAFDAKSFSQILAKHVDELIDEVDIAVDKITEKFLPPMTRDEAVLLSMASTEAYTEEGRAFARKKGWGGGSAIGFVEWIAQHYPLEHKRDPVTAWRKRAALIGAEKNPHKALEKYQAFIVQTTKARTIFEECQHDFEVYIEHEIEIVRQGKTSSG